MMEHKSGNMSERGKDRRKITMGAYRISPTLFRMVPSPTPYGLPFPNIGGSQPHPQFIAIISRKEFKCRRYNHRVQLNKGPSKIIEEKRLGVSRDCISSAIIKGTVEAKDFKFDRYILRVHPNESPLKILLLSNLITTLHLYLLTLVINLH